MVRTHVVSRVSTAVKTEQEREGAFFFQSRGRFQVSAQNWGHMFLFRAINDRFCLYRFGISPPTPKSGEIGQEKEGALKVEFFNKNG